MKMFIVAVFVVALAGVSNAEGVACTEKGRPIYDPDFCKAVRISREAFELNRQLIDKSEAIRQSIDRQLRQQLEEMKSRGN